MKILFELRNIPINEVRKVIARNVPEACERLSWQRKNVVLITKKVMPDDFDESSME